VPNSVDNDCVVAEARNYRGGKVCGAFLSGDMADAIRQIAHDEERSVSHVIRALLRSELRHRGLSPSPAI
jgi:hypothetical protein